MGKKKKDSKTSNEIITETKNVADGYLNLASKVGVGQKNMISAGTYVFNELTHNRIKLEAMYRTNWLVGAAIDNYASDMLRSGINLSGDIEPSESQTLQTKMSTSGMWKALLEVLKWGNLYGGAVAIINIAGQDPLTPLRLDTVGQDQFLGLSVFDRWYITPDITQVVQFGPEAGNPVFYDLLANAITGDVKFTRVHYSRLIRIVGNDLPYSQKIFEQMWGQSIVERIVEVLNYSDSSTGNASNLVEKANVRVMQIDRLREILAAGGMAVQNMQMFFEEMQILQSNAGLSLIDKEDEYSTFSYAFSGLSDVMAKFDQKLAGALKQPLIRLFLESVSGLSSNGETQLRMYYDNILADQESILRDPMLKLTNVLYRSCFGKPPPENFDFSFVPLWQTTEKEKMDISASGVDQVVKAVTAGIITEAIALRELKKLSEITGMFSTIDDDDIAEAEIEPPPSFSITPSESDLGEANNEDDPLDG